MVAKRPWTAEENCEPHMVCMNCGNVMIPNENEDSHMVMSDDDEPLFVCDDKETADFVVNAVNSFSNMCDICCGSAKLLDGSPCMCGDGTLYGLVSALRRKIVALEKPKKKRKKATKKSPKKKGQ